MGASCWAHFAAYDPDLTTVLQQVRQQVFAAGDYQSPDVPLAGSSPATLDELIDAVGESGTHSIIDINGGLSDVPDFAMMAPFPAVLYAELLQTHEPTHAMVVAKIESGELFDLCRSWEGFYILIYADNEPVEVCFVGCSGD